MNEQAIRFRFGVFILASLILMAVLVILFGGFPNYFKRTESYTIIFTNAQGVTPGTPVRRSGVRIGEVRAVTLDNVTGKVEVGIRIEEIYFLRKGDVPTLFQGLLGGDAAIAFLPPEDEKLADPTPVPPGSILIGATPPDAGSVLAKTSDLVKPAQEALVEIRKVFQGIDRLGPVVEQTIKDFREVGKMARDVGPELQETAKEVRMLSKSARENIEKLSPDVLKTTEEFRALSKATREFIPDFKKTNEEIQLTARNWGKVGERMDVLLRANEEKIVKTLDRMEDTLKRVNSLFNDQNMKYINETLRNVRNGSQNLEAIAKDTGDLIKDTRVTLKQVTDSLKKADEAITSLQKVMQPLGDKGPAILKNLEEGTDNLNRTLKDVREILREVARSDGTVQKLLTDPALYNNLNDSAAMVTKILPRLDRVMRDVETFADKLARHPELLGLRGAFVPSSGLKESPSMPYRTYP